MMRDNTQPERGQAYTLEGFIGAMVVLMAVLLALQSVVIAPTTGGAVDRTQQAQVQQEVQDVLTIAADDHDTGLSNMTRHWDGEGGFEGANDRVSDSDDEVYSTEDGELRDRFPTFGTLLHDRFHESGQTYNVELHYQTEDGADTKPVVYQGSPSSNAVTASYTVTLYDDHYVSSDPDDEDIDTLEQAADDPDYNETIPRMEDHGDELYNVVEVRVIVW